MAEDQDNLTLKEALKIQKELGAVGDANKAIQERLNEEIARMNDNWKDVGHAQTKYNEQRNRALILNAKAQEYAEAGKRQLAEKTRMEANAAANAADAMKNHLEDLRSNAIAEDKLSDEKKKQLEALKLIEQHQENTTKAILGAVAATAQKLVGLKAIKEVLISSNSLTVDLSKQFGTSLENARGVREEFEEFAQTSTRVDFERLTKAQFALGQAIGQNVMYSNEMAEDFVEITEYMGLSSDAAGKLALVSTGLGQSSEEFRSGIADSLLPLNQSLGINLSIKEAYESIGKLSSTTLVNLNRMPDRMMELVAVTKRFGLEMQQLTSFSDALLNFESSIAAELEAEVLTGRQLNLERARAAALRGDEVALAKELAQQVGSIAEFEKMNVIQRESLAKAFGMNVESMSAMLLRQEAMTQLTGEARDASDEQLAAAKEYQKAMGGASKVSLQDALEEIQQREDANKRFEDSMRKLKTILADVLSSLDPVIDTISKMVKNIAESPIFKTLVGAASIVTVGATMAKSAMSLMAGLRGTRFMPMYVKMAGVGGGLGRTLPGGSRYGAAMRMNQAGRFGMSRAMGAGAGLGFAAGGAVVQMAGNALADKFQESGNTTAAQTTDVVSGVGQGALYGAALGSIVPVVGTAAGAVIGGAIGLISGGVEAANRRAEEEAKKEEERQTKLERTLEKLAMAEAKVLIDSNEMGRGLTLGNNYRI